MSAIAGAAARLETRRTNQSASTKALKGAAGALQARPSVERPEPPRPTSDKVSLSREAAASAGAKAEVRSSFLDAFTSNFSSDDATPKSRQDKPMMMGYMAPVSGDADEENKVRREIENQGDRPVWRGQKVEEQLDAQEEKLRNENDSLRKQIDTLQPGESLVRRSKGDLKVQVPRVKVAQAGVELETKTTVEKNEDGSYKVSAENGTSLVGTAEVKSKTVDASAEVAVGTESNGEYEFKTLDDAKRGAYVLGRGGADNEKDEQFLEEHRLSEERVYKTSLGVKAPFPLDSPGVKPGTNWEAKGEAQDSVKFIYKRNKDGSFVKDENGKKVVDSVEYAQKVKGNITGKGTVQVATVEIETGDKVGGEIEVIRKKTVKVPPGVDPEELKRDPKGTLEKYPPDPAQSSSETIVNIKGQARTKGTDGKTDSVYSETQTTIRDQQPEKDSDGNPVPPKPRVETKTGTKRGEGEASGGSVDLVFVQVGTESEEEKITPTGERTIYQSN